jgi:hypothetical protein
MDQQRLSRPHLLHGALYRAPWRARGAAHAMGTVRGDVPDAAHGGGHATDSCGRSRGARHVDVAPSEKDEPQRATSADHLTARLGRSGPATARTRAGTRCDG